MKKLIVFCIIIAILLAGCTPKPATPAALKPIKLVLGYIPNIQFAPVYVAIEKGYFADEGLAVTLEYGKETDALALIGAGQLSFAVASGEQILLARAQGLPVKYVAAWFQEYPVGVVSLAEANITSPAQLAGKKVGIPGVYGASYIGLIALLNAGQLDESNLTLESIGYTQVEALMTGQVDAAVIYNANEPQVLINQGLLVNNLEVADYLDLVSNGLVTSDNLVENDPELVSGMVNALLKGIHDTIGYPDEAYELSKAHVESLAQADEALQKSILAASIENWQTDRLGFSQPAGWQNMQQVLLEMGLLKETLTLEDAYTNEFIPE